MTVVLTSPFTSGRRLGPVLTRLAFAKSRQRASQTADLIDQIVDGSLELIRVLPVHERARPAERLAPLVALAQTHRHYAAGWISRREFRRRCHDPACWHF